MIGQLCTEVTQETSTLILGDITKKPRKKIKGRVKVQSCFLSNSHKDFQIVYYESN